MKCNLNELEEIAAKAPVIRQARSWSADRMRAFCIRNGFYKDGDNEEYAGMLRFVSNMKPTPLNLYIVARDIVKYSECEFIDPDDDDDVSDMMEMIESQVVETFYYVGESE